MNATGFWYDGRSTEEFGLTICQFGSSGNAKTVSAGSELTWSTTPVKHGVTNLLADASYDSVLETTFRICKYDCMEGILIPFSYEERREITRWLNRKDYHMLNLIGPDEICELVSFEGSFNLKEINSGKDTIGYELYFTSNRPFALGKMCRKTIHALSQNFTYKLYDVSDEIGYIYPHQMTIECKSSGTLTIHNSIEDRTTTIKNCSYGEVITFDDSLNISTSLPSHAIQNDFNFTFFRVANSYRDRTNILTISMPCEITLEYYPVVKGVGL